jgi:hypothetical protein
MKKKAKPIVKSVRSIRPRRPTPRQRIVSIACAYIEAMSSPKTKVDARQLIQELRIAVQALR